MSSTALRPSVYELMTNSRYVTNVAAVCQPEADSSHATRPPCARRNDCNDALGFAFAHHRRAQERAIGSGGEHSGERSAFVSAQRNRQPLTHPPDARRRRVGVPPCRFISIDEISRTDACHRRVTFVKEYRLIAYTIAHANSSTATAARGGHDTRSITHSHYLFLTHSLISPTHSPLTQSLITLAHSFTHRERVQRRVALRADDKSPNAIARGNHAPTPMTR